MFLSSLRKVKRMDHKSLQLGYLIDDIFRVNLNPDIERTFVGLDLNPDEIISLPYEINFL